MFLKQKQKKDGAVYKTWTAVTLAATAVILVAAGAYVAYIDPCFHYHAPLEKYFYPLFDERYQSNGIERFFDYDAVITGTSMVENFKTSEMDALFDCNAIKIPFGAAWMPEIKDNLTTVYESGHDVKYVILSLDEYAFLVDDPDAYDYIYEYPTYMTNKNPFDDVEYLLNKEMLLTHAIEGVYGRDADTPQTTSFDDYVRWNEKYEFGRDQVLRGDTGEGRDYANTPYDKNPISDEEVSRIHAVIDRNLLPIIEAHPETTFYFFVPPYSIYNWEGLRKNGAIQRRADIERTIFEAFFPYENVRLYSFYEEYDMVCDLDNYKDLEHYSGEVNSRILQWMAADEHRITPENYETYLQNITAFYSSYDYTQIFS